MFGGYSQLPRGKWGVYALSMTNSHDERRRGSCENCHQMAAI